MEVYYFRYVMKKVNFDKHKKKITENKIPLFAKGSLSC